MRNKLLDEELLDVVLSIAHITDVHTLIEKILSTLRGLTTSDAASLYMYDSSNNTLVFRYTQNDSVSFPFKEFSIPCDDSSVAGFVGNNRREIVLDDVYDIDAAYPFVFNKLFDQMVNYRSKSMVVLPIFNTKNNLIAVIQFINKKYKAEDVITPGNADHIISPYTEDDIAVLKTLLGIVGISLENSTLYADIENLLDGMIQTCIKAIESRDKVTAGHTEMISIIAMRLAKAMSDDSEIFGHFTMDENGEKVLRYAALLHDFGKIGVSERILKKSNKLYPEELAEIKCRYSVAKNVSILRNYPRGIVEVLEEMWDIVLRLDSPEGRPQPYDQKKLKAFSHILFEDALGNEFVVLMEDELHKLIYLRGSLDKKEMAEIERHVLYTYNYLVDIPWPKELKDVPAIAAMHHEKLDGTGYPFGLADGDISIYGRILAIADIFEALTSKDRPYKGQLSDEDAIDILFKEADANRIDYGIVKFFKDKKLYE